MNGEMDLGFVLMPKQSTEKKKKKDGMKWISNDWDIFNI